METLQSFCFVNNDICSQNFHGSSGYTNTPQCHIVGKLRSLYFVLQGVQLVHVFAVYLIV